MIMTADAARELIRRNHFCVIATASQAGRPWISPVFFNYDAGYRLIWESARDALHSRLIAENPRAAIVISDLDAAALTSALYLDCRASEVPPESLAEALAIFLDGPHEKSEPVQRSVADYLGDKPLRLYQAIPERVYGIVQTETPEGYRIDQRMELTLT
jgi:nitroimidazol reductase NimA-like FMN-containing flavoprotein (pyridoxamine 5'-phosphate oxidase superfamily)